MNEQEAIYEQYEKIKNKPKKLSDAFISKQARLFFDQNKTDEKISELIVSCKNTSEMMYRLTWLSEGSLQYHLLGTPVSHGGNSVEKELYNQFQEYLNQFR